MEKQLVKTIVTKLQKKKNCSFITQTFLAVVLILTSRSTLQTVVFLWILFYLILTNFISNSISNSEAQVTLVAITKMSAWILHRTQAVCHHCWAGRWRLLSAFLFSWFSEISRWYPELCPLQASPVIEAIHICERKVGRNTQQLNKAIYK